MDLNSTDESSDDEPQPQPQPVAVAAPLPQAEEVEEAVEVVEVEVEVEEEDGVEVEEEEELEIVVLSEESGGEQGPEAMGVTVVTSSAAIPATAQAAAGPSTAAGPAPAAVAIGAAGWRQAAAAGHDCGECLNCRDKLKFGGPGIKRKSCLLHTKSAEQPAPRAPVARNNRPKPVATVEPDEKVASGCAACAGVHRKHTCGKAVLPSPPTVASKAPKAPKAPKPPKSPKVPKVPKVSASKPLAAEEVSSGLTVAKILGYKAYPKARPG